MINTGILVTAPIRPNDSLDSIASAYANEIKGGHHGYSTLAERDSLILERREWGMLVSVYNDGSNNGIYKLEYNYVDTDLSNNSNWVSFSGGSISGTTWLNSVISLKTDPPVGPVGGDRYLIGTTASGAWFANEEKIAQWSTDISSWVYTTPTDGSCVVVNDTPGSIYQYIGTYSSGNWTQQVFGGLSNKYLIQNENIQVPLGSQFFIYGDLTIGTAGTLVNYGQVVTLNGSIVIESSGTFSNFGLYYSPSINVTKYTQSFTMSAFETLTITHNLNSQDIFVSAYEALVPINLDYIILNNDQLSISSMINISNGKINIIS